MDDCSILFKIQISQQTTLRKVYYSVFKSDTSDDILYPFCALSFFPKYAILT